MMGLYDTFLENKDEVSGENQLSRKLNQFIN